MRIKPYKFRFSQKPAALLSAARSYRLSRSSLEPEKVPAETNQEFITAKQAAAWLGIPLRSFYQYVREGLLPSYKLGRHRLFNRMELLAALGNSRLASRTEILR